MGLLWFCGFLNYADRQAVFGVLPMVEREFGLTKADQGLIGSAFMVVYALASPATGFVVDRLSRKRLIVGGLAIWSVICAATALSRRFEHLLVFRALEGLGESFYFPATMSLLADYHGPRTRSRAMSLHQTSVYVGIAGGGAFAWLIARRYGWRAPFGFLGAAGVLYAAAVAVLLREPARGGSEPEAEGRDGRPDWLGAAGEVVRSPAAALLVAFAGANFVTMALTSWMPSYVYGRFPESPTKAVLTGTVFLPLASLPGALVGGALADRAARRWRGGRMAVQGLALLAATPFVFLAARAGSLATLAVALAAIGLCKGIYEANIFASAYDVVRPEVRGTAAGLMNTVGWAGASLAPFLVGAAGDRVGLGRALAATSVAYAAAAVAALGATRWAGRRRPAVAP